ncbi:DUF3307 domain-containing protein [Micromonospora fluostatini]|uniref:DUF3307 domain-containing protein n=1 Tax=Micromonospora fluostatini TaxID=1629071 RepID=A0ABY2DI91_9ACTN|nr:DUF3307 domain-containing protein [Micromonospora fluostatini]
MKRTVPTADPAVSASIFTHLLVAHHLGDYLVQRSSDAEAKSKSGPEGRRACTRHVTSYTATQLATVVLGATATGVRLRPGSVLAGAALSAVTHWVIDRRTPLQTFARAVGREKFYSFGAPREGHGDNPCLGTGAHAIDQTLHKLVLAGSALLMGLGARRVR